MICRHVRYRSAQCTERIHSFTSIILADIVSLQERGIYDGLIIASRTDIFALMTAS